jgi:hypothetical protein
MENRIDESCMDRYDELSHRISEAESTFEFREALEDMEVYLTAQQEIAAMLEVFTIQDAMYRREARRSI